MRDYSKVRPLFWRRGTGKALRGDCNAQLVALYLMTCPDGHMTGLFYLALPTLAHETGLTLEGATKGLARLSEEGFAHYDAPSEVVFLPSGAREQIGESLSAGDKQCKGIRAWVAQFKKHRFYAEFVRIYADAYHLHDLLGTSPFQAPSKPLRSQEQEQEQEQEQAREARALEAAPPEESETPLDGDRFRLRRHVETRFTALVTSATGYPPGKGAKYPEQLAKLVTWLWDAAVARNVEELPLADKLLAGFMADADARAKGYPLGYLAQNPPQYLASPKPADRSAPVPACRRPL